MIDKIRALYKKYEELVLYVICGGLTTLVNIVVYGLCADILGIFYLVSNFIAWALSVLFAYVTNRKWVFKSKKRGKRAILHEVFSFCQRPYHVHGRRYGDYVFMCICGPFSGTVLRRSLPIFL